MVTSTDLEIRRVLGSEENWGDLSPAMQSETFNKLFRNPQRRADRYLWLRSISIAQYERFNLPTKAYKGDMYIIGENLPKKTLYSQRDFPLPYMCLLCIPFIQGSTREIFPLLHGSTL